MDRGRRYVKGRVGRYILIESELEGFIGSEEGSGRGNRYENDRANSLVQAPVQSTICSAIGIPVELLIRRRLYACLESVEGIN